MQEDHYNFNFLHSLTLNMDQTLRQLPQVQVHINAGVIPDFFFQICF